MKNILLFSPIIPMRTGTADYFEKVLAELAGTRISRDHITIVIDDSHFYGGDLFRDRFGFRVASYRQLSDVVSSNETRIYFLANNEFHSYCYESLSRCRKMPGGRIVSVIHEPSCFMLLNNMCSNNRNGFVDADLERFARSQFGEKAGAFVAARRRDDLPFEVEFVIHCQELALRLSDEIWTHSEFCALKLQIESEAECQPKFVVSEHPHMSRVGPGVSLPQELMKPAGQMRIGIFGWVSPAKRVDTAIRAFANALQTVPFETRARAELLIVGKLPDPAYYDPVGLASALGVDDRVTFLDYVSLDQFEALIETCDLLLNLRFPSCGETSGTLERAVAAGVPVVTTEYQGFAELPTSAHTSPFWPKEQIQLFRLLCGWLRGQGNLMPAPRAPKRRGIAELILREA